MQKKTLEKNPNYFEAVLQLRNPNDEMFRFIDNQLKGRKDVFVAKEEELKTGVDIYISSWRFAIALGRKLKRSYKGEIKISRRLHTRNKITSKDVYRVTVLFRSFE